MEWVGSDCEVVAQLDELSILFTGERCVRPSRGVVRGFPGCFGGFITETWAIACAGIPVVASLGDSLNFAHHPSTLPQPLRLC